jgi:hypothetical protein
MTKEECEKLVKEGKRVMTPIDRLGYYSLYIDECLGLCAYQHSNAEMCNGVWFPVKEDEKLLNNAFVYNK